MQVWLHVVASFQVFTQPIYEALETSLTTRWAKLERHILWLRIVWRSLYVIIITLIAAAFPFFTDLMGLIGALGFIPMTVRHCSSWHRCSCEWPEQVGPAQNCLSVPEQEHLHAVGSYAFTGSARPRLLLSTVHTAPCALPVSNDCCLQFVMPCIIWLVVRRGQLGKVQLFANWFIIVVFTLVAFSAFVASAASIAIKKRHGQLIVWDT